MAVVEQCAYDFGVCLPKKGSKTKNNCAWQQNIFFKECVAKL